MGLSYRLVVSVLGERTGGSGVHRGKGSGDGEGDMVVVIGIGGMSDVVPVVGRLRGGRGVDENSRGERKVRRDRAYKS